jgi:hypothetical protein
VSAHNSAPVFGFTSSPAEELAAMRGILSHLAPKKEDDVRMVAAALKTHGRSSKNSFLNGLAVRALQSKRLWAKVKADPDAMTEVIERQVTALSKNNVQPATRRSLGSNAAAAMANQGVFPIEGLAVVYGASTAGKSFLSLEMAASIGDGLPFFEHATKPAAVLYVGLEGEGGYRGGLSRGNATTGAPYPIACGSCCNRSALPTRRTWPTLPPSVRPAASCLSTTLDRAAPGMDENSSRVWAQ